METKSNGSWLFFAGMVLFAGGLLMIAIAIPVNASEGTHLQWIAVTVEVAAGLICSLIGIVPAWKYLKKELVLIISTIVFYVSIGYVSISNTITHGTPPVVWFAYAIPILSAALMLGTGLTLLINTTTKEKDPPNTGDRDY